jgi:hypothetical protein
MNFFTKLLAVALVGSAAFDAPAARERQRESCAANVLVEWNERVLAIAAAEDGFLTLKGVRTAAMMHVAMHDAINSIHRHYAHYAYRADGTDADPVIAAAQAAYEVAAGQYPNQQVMFERDLRKWLARAANEDARRRAIALGQAAAHAIRERRERDRWDGQREYRFQSPGPGVYAEFPEHSGTPSGFVFGAAWGAVEPFTMMRPDQFTVSPPPAVSSSAYASAYNEVREMGRYQSRTRSAEQTHIALWWKDFAENSHNRLARALIAERGTDLWSAARMFALLNMSILDGYVAVFDAKFTFNHWRPYTAIRAADRDGNPQTHADDAWTNTHRHTYPFPSYPSAHGTVCAAAMTVLADTFGRKQAFTMRTSEVASAGPQSAPRRAHSTVLHQPRWSAPCRACISAFTFGTTRLLAIALARRSGAMRSKGIWCRRRSRGVHGPVPHSAVPI